MYINILIVSAEKTFKKILFRILDGGWFDQESEELKRLSQIELEVFKNILKEVESETDCKWSGSIKENSLADVKIAKSIRNSLINYERDRKDQEPTYVKI